MLSYKDYFSFHTKHISNATNKKSHIIFHTTFFLFQVFICKLKLTHSQPLGITLITFIKLIILNVWCNIVLQTVLTPFNNIPLNTLQFDSQLQKMTAEAQFICRHCHTVSRHLDKINDCAKITPVLYKKPFYTHHFHLTPNPQTSGTDLRPSLAADY